MKAANAYLNMKSVISRKFRGQVSTDTFSPGEEYSLGAFPLLTAHEGRDFVILNITDIHFSDFDKRALMAFDAIRTVKALVKMLNPDLITVTGDIVCGKSTAYSIERFTDMMNDFKIPWAPVFGNHDDEANCDKNYLADIMMSSPYCLLKKGDKRLGCGNYVVNIAKKDGECFLPVLSLIMMDSRSGEFSPLHLEYLKWAAKGICEATGKTVPCAAFFHIPNAQYQYAYDEAWDEENSCWREGCGGSGELHEKICCPRDCNDEPVDDGFFDAAISAGNIKHIFCGHEHVNNFSVMYKGVRLTYTLKVGKASGHRAGFNGGTKITVLEDGIKEIKNIFII